MHTNVELDLRQIRDNANCVEMTRTEARQFVDAYNEDDELLYAFDKAQGDAANDGAQYVVIKIV